MPSRAAQQGSHRAVQLGGAWQGSYRAMQLGGAQQGSHGATQLSRARVGPWVSMGFGTTSTIPLLVDYFVACGSSLQKKKCTL